MQQNPTRSVKLVEASSPHEGENPSVEQKSEFWRCPISVLKIPLLRTNTLTRNETACIDAFSLSSISNRTTFVQVALADDRESTDACKTGKHVRILGKITFGT